MEPRELDAKLRAKLGLPDGPSLSESWEGMGMVVEAMESRDFEWHVWPKAAEFSERFQRIDRQTIRGYCEWQGHIRNTALAAARALGMEVDSE